MNKPTVFISSTIEGMQSTRQVVRDLLGKDLGYNVLMSEYEGSKPKRPIEQCKKWAKECDIFISIIGHDYGWIIPDLNLSVCEFEFNEAYKDNPEKIFIYVSSSKKDNRQKKFEERITNFKEGYYRGPKFKNDSELLVGIRDDIAEYFKGLLGIVRSKKLKVKNRITPTKEDYAILTRSNRIQAMMNDTIALASERGFEEVKHTQPLFWSAAKILKRKRILFTFIVIPDSLNESWMREIRLRHIDHLRYDPIYESYPNRFTLVIVHGSANLSTLGKETRFFSGTCFKIEPGLYLGADLTGLNKKQGELSDENRVIISKITNKIELSGKFADALEWINRENSRINFKSNFRKSSWLRRKRGK